MCEPLAEPECGGNPGCTYNAYPGCVAVAESVVEPVAEPEGGPEVEPAVAEAEADVDLGGPVSDIIFCEFKTSQSVASHLGSPPVPNTVSLRITDGGPVAAILSIFTAYVTLAHTSQRMPQYNVNPTRWWVKDGGALSSQMASFHNTYPQVLAITTPAIVGTILCPLTLIIRPFMADYFWGGLPGDAINDALAAFLAPNGFVYAIIFAYAYQNAITKNFEVRFVTFWPRLAFLGTHF